MADIIKSYNDVTRRNKDMNDGTYAEVVSAVSSNVTTKLQEPFEFFDTTKTWTLSKAAGDIVRLDGNAVGASYLVISKDPLAAGTETSLTANVSFKMPLEGGFGFHASQRTLGQEFSNEIVDFGTIPPVADIAISTISQSTTTLTVNTVGDHGLSVGARFGIHGVPDSRMNYPSLVVGAVTSPTQFTATAGPGGTLASLTVGPFVGGFVYMRSALGYAQNGVSMIFENATATNASFYIRSGSGESLPSGTVSGSHSITVATTASVAPITSAYTYAFQPTSEYRLVLQPDRVQWSSGVVDGLAQNSSAVNRTQIVPEASKLYQFRIRATNNKGLTVPNAQVVTAVKTGTTTATVTTDVAHGLATTDVVVLYGARDQTNFPNVVTATAVASIVSPTQFTIVWGGAVTATTFGGYVARVQGGNLMSALGGLTMAAQSATLASGVLAVVGSTVWAGAVIGDYVNVVGLRDFVTGATLACDGAYRIQNIASTTLTLEPIGDTVVPADFASTNCGGAVIKRTDYRVSFVRLFDYVRERIEAVPRPFGDNAFAMPVTVQGGLLSAAGSVSTIAPSNYFLNSAASTNGALIVTTTMGVSAFFASNIGATPAYVKLYNKATAPTVGTDVPEMVITVPATGQVEVTPGFYGYRFPLGLGIAITGAAADTDTTAVAAGQVKVKLSRAV
jgi:hypothetical protein